MPTLRAIASTASGLYRDVRSGREYRHDELLQAVPHGILSRPVRIEKQSTGVYRLHVENGDGYEFELRSRRRQRRALPDPA